MPETENLLERELTGKIVKAFFKVYNSLGFGFLENVYSSALAMELGWQGLRVQREVGVQVYYCGQPAALYRVDLLVEQRVLVEVKSTKALVESDRRQLLNYLRATDLQVALLLHFGPTPKLHRLVSSNTQIKRAHPAATAPVPR